MEMQSNEIGELVKALVAVQAQLKPAKKNANNPFFKSDYADLSSCWDACKDLLSANGLMVTQTMGIQDGKNTLTTILSHTSGQYIRGEQYINPVKNDPQAAGSAITYARRYGLCAIVGIVAGDDDDGNAGSRPEDKKPAQGKSGPPASNTPETHCMFGKNKGKKWSDMSLDNLEWYKGMFEESIKDASKDQYKATNEKYLKGVNDAIEAKEA